MPPAGDGAGACLAGAGACLAGAGPVALCAPWPPAEAGVGAGVGAGACAAVAAAVMAAAAVCARQVAQQCVPRTTADSAQSFAVACFAQLNVGHLSA